MRMMTDAFAATLLAWLGEQEGDVATVFKQTKPKGCLGIESTIEAQVWW